MKFAGTKLNWRMDGGEENQMTIILSTNIFAFAILQICKGSGWKCCSCSCGGPTAEALVSKERLRINKIARIPNIESLTCPPCFGCEIKSKEINTPLGERATAKITHSTRNVLLSVQSHCTTIPWEVYMDYPCSTCMMSVRLDHNSAVKRIHDTTIEPW